MNLADKESVSLIANLKKGLRGKINADIVVCPPFTSLLSVSMELKKSGIHLGAQNMHFMDKGAYTGEISASMLKELGCEYVIIGHSERRSCFGENDGLINKKILSAIQNKLIPILCVGERLEQRNGNLQNMAVEGQLINGLKGVNKTNFAVAYEPVWAIGTGKNATPEQAEGMHCFIREILNKKYGNAKIKILYGGSATPENAKGLLQQRNIDGLLVGGASLSAKLFLKIIKSA